MLFDGPLLSATFVDRPNRFLGVVEMKGETVRCFIPNPGRMRELLHPDAKVYLLEKASGDRKTRYDLTLVRVGASLVSIDSRTPNKVVEEAIEAEALPEFRGLGIAKKEPVFGDSRLDFLLGGGADTVLMEVKSCTLVKEGVALFPDAPTERGTRHVRTLVGALKTGRAAMLFLVQRGDADALSPNEETDPLFSEALREASRQGVETYAYNSKVTLENISINRRIPVKLRPSGPASEYHRAT